MIFARSGIVIGATLALLAASILISIELAPAAPSERAAPLATDGPAAARPWIRYGGWPKRDTSKFNSLSAIVSPPPPKTPRKITTPVAGDPVAGQKAGGRPHARRFVHRLPCHGTGRWRRSARQCRTRLV